MAKRKIKAGQVYRGEAGRYCYSSEMVKLGRPEPGTLVTRIGPAMNGPNTYEMVLKTLPGGHLAYDSFWTPLGGKRVPISKNKPLMVPQLLQEEIDEGHLVLAEL